MKRLTFAILVIVITYACGEFIESAQAKYSGGSGEPNDPYQIADVNDLLTLAADTNDYNKCFILTADVNMEGQVFTTAIIAADASSDSFGGTFDGNGHKIIHFTINGGSNSYLGLFGYISGTGSVKNLGLENCSASGSSGSQYVGGLVGLNSGSISNCYSTSAVSGVGYVGGLVGYNYDAGSISGCYSTGAVSCSSDSYCIGGLVGKNDGGSISNCYSTGVVSGKNYVGGLAGHNYGNISNCYSTGTVSGSSESWNVGGLAGHNYGNISNCYSTSAVSGSSYVGGLVGENWDSISNCYSTGAVSGKNDVGGLVGGNWYGNGSINSSYFLITSGPSNGYGTPLADTQMKQQASFAGWDFVWETINGPNDVWAICEGASYPKLAWQYIVGDSDNDKNVDFTDFAEMGLKWLQPDLTLYCGGADLTGDGLVDLDDLDAFVENWLESQ